MTIPAGSFPHLVYYGGTTQCIGCGLTVDPLGHKRCPAHGTAAYCDNQHPAWGKEEEIAKLAEIRDAVPPNPAWKSSDPAKEWNWPPYTEEKLRTAYPATETKAPPISEETGGAV